jgi:hypothetical protein
MAVKSPFPVSNVIEFASSMGEEIYDPHSDKNEYFVGLTDRFHERFLGRANSTKPGHEVEFIFLKSQEFNAWAASHRGHDVIAMNAAVVAILANLFARLMSDPQSMSWIGNAGSETLAAISVKEGLHSRLLVGARQRPKDALRGRVAHHMASLASMWVFQHELAHIWNGHVDLLHERRGFRSIDELKAASRTGIGSLDLQTLEMDADSYATTNVLLQAIQPRLDRPSDFSELTFPEFEEIGPGASMAYIAMFAIYFLFRSFDEALNLGVDLDRASHPPAPVRQGFAMTSAMVTIETHFGIPQSRTRALAKTVVSHAEEAFARITERQPILVDDALKSWNRDFAARVFRNWNALRPDLDRLKRGGNLPPVSTAWDEAPPS